MEDDEEFLVSLIKTTCLKVSEAMVYLFKIALPSLCGCLWGVLAG
jgi:hypothetical protein